jgi:glycosyltransferase involved in cell wall biosynthesis
MKVSVICTAKNAECTIERALNSILHQEFQDWELVVVDDGSSDGTADVVSAVAQADPRVRIIPTGGVGRGRALNLALKEAQADFVANIDADDESHPNRLDWTLAALKSHPEFALICTTCMVIKDFDAPNWTEARELGRTAARDITQRLALFNPVAHSSVLMRRSVISKLGGYREDLRNNFDYDLWVRLAAAGFRVGQLEQPLVAKRVHPGQAFERKQRLHYVFRSVVIQARAIRALKLSWIYWILLIARFLWGMLPARLRLVAWKSRIRPPEDHTRQG